MNKKQKLQSELSEAVKREATSDDCPYCGVRFYGSSLSRESHRHLYPSHFTGAPQPSVEKEEAAAVENLKGRWKRRQQKEGTFSDENLH
jgi:hypothetical protein